MEQDKDGEALVDIFTALDCVDKGCIAKTNSVFPARLVATSVIGIYFDSQLGLIERQDLIENYRSEKFSIWKYKHTENE